MREPGRSAGIGAGGSSLLVVFVVLCLTTFATLSLVSARADHRLSVKSVEALDAYYAADAAAQRQLRDISSAVVRTPALPQDDLPGAAARIEGALAGLDVECSFDGSRIEAGFSVPVREGQRLFVSADLTGLISGGELQVLQYQVQNTDEIQPEESGPTLWSGSGVPLPGLSE